MAGFNLRLPFHPPGKYLGRSTSIRSDPILFIIVTLLRRECSAGTSVSNEDVFETV